jgi:hypothetical protein
MSADELTAGKLRELLASVHPDTPIRVLPGWPVVDQDTGICPETAPTSVYYGRHEQGAQLVLVLVPDGLASEMLAILDEEDEKTH